jgi:hypothetical protein
VRKSRCLLMVRRASREGAWAFNHLLYHRRSSSLSVQDQLYIFPGLRHRTSQAQLGQHTVRGIVSTDAHLLAIAIMGEFEGIERTWLGK